MAVLSSVIPAIKGFGRFWYDFIIGDDWKIAVAVLLALAVTLGLVLTGALPIGLTTALGGLLLLGFFVASLVVDVRS